jgi:glutamate dehydrogenase (NADP+)
MPHHNHLPHEPEFQQAVHEITSTLAPLLHKIPEYQKALEVVQIPERVIQFRVVWEDDHGKLHVNRGYRVQFNSALGPYKGGLRFHPTVNLSILKFLGFEQTFKNALTGLMMGGGKGGSDFDPKGRSDNEIRKFCYAFMQELSRHIGADTDVPAGDIGVGGREVAYMFGAYKKYRNEFTGILTGKGLHFGGSYIRPEATGYGLVYYVGHMLKQLATPTDYVGKRVLISGAGNVAQYAALKVIELGGSVLSLSDSKGSLTAKEGTKGFTVEDISAIANLKLKHKYLHDFVQHGHHAERFEYHEGKRPWTLFEKVDIALPSATQNEVSEDEAKHLVKAGCKIVAEGSNMGSTQAAIDVFEHSRVESGAEGIWYAPGKAANCGGVAVSGLEMAQNSQRLQWSPEEVDQKLKDIMKDCYEICHETGLKYGPVGLKAGTPPSLVMGANIAGFIKVADAMKAQGDWW